MSSYPRILYVVGRGLSAQRFRRVDLRGVATTGAITLPTASNPQVDAALAQLTGDADWIEVARQLAQLRLSGFAGVYLRQDKHDVEFVSIYGFNGVLALSTFVQYLEFVHTVTESMDRLLGAFQLSENTVAILGRAASALDGAAPPERNKSPAAPGASLEPIPPGEDLGPIGQQEQVPAEMEQSVAATPPVTSPEQRIRNAAASLLRLICELSFAKKPKTGVAGIAIGGPAVDLWKIMESRLTGPVHYGPGLNPSQTYPIVIDGRNFAARCQGESFGGLKFEQFERSLPFLARYG